MYHIKDDQRSIRSSEMLYEGLAKLMREKEYAAITVTDLVEAAGVGRTTFYRNFDDIEDILRLKSDQVFEDLIRYLKKYRLQNLDEPASVLLKPILRYFYINSELIELLILAHRIDIAQESFARLLGPSKAMYGMRYGVKDDYLEYIITARISATIHILTHWVKTGMKQAPDELADTLHEILSNNDMPFVQFL